jgi:hypothetical protein
MLKLFLILSLILCSSVVEADVGDIYFCSSVRNMSVIDDETNEHPPKAFSFSWVADDAIRLSNYTFRLFGVKKSGAETFAGSDLEVGGYHSVIFREGSFKHVSLPNYTTGNQIMSYVLANCEKSRDRRNRKP